MKEAIGQLNLGDYLNASCASCAGRIQLRHSRTHDNQVRAGEGLYRVPTQIKFAIVELRNLRLQHVFLLAIANGDASATRFAKVRDGDTGLSQSDDDDVLVCEIHGLDIPSKRVAPPVLSAA